MDVSEYRRKEERLIAERPNLSGGYPSGTFREASVPTSAGSTRILTYLPRTRKAERFPVYVNLHGGGFVLGFPEVDDPYCRRISDEAQCVVVNVDYALAPEHPFPAAVEECYDVVMALGSDPGAFPIDPTRIAVGGHSAGGNLAAAVCLLARQRSKPRIVLQILDYAVLDLATSPRAKQSEPTPPDDLVELAEHYNAWYLQSAEDARNPLASPVLAQDLTGLPAALVVAAENDILRDEDELYAKRLRAAGVPVVSKTYLGCGHGFTHIGPREAAEDAWRLICSSLGEALHA